jgi:hypothetical protein
VTACRPNPAALFEENSDTAIARVRLPPSIKADAVIEGRNARHPMATGQLNLTWTDDDGATIDHTETRPAA